MKKYIILALCASLFALSCENKEEVIEDAPESGLKMITVSCTLPVDSTDSKVTLTNDGESGKIAWEQDVDQVLFHGEYMGQDATHTYSFVATAKNVSNNGKTAQFTIPDLDNKYGGGSNYRSSMFAIYPASAVATYSAGSHWYYLSCFKETNQLMLAACNDTSVDEGRTFTFFNLTGAISFKVEGDFDKYVFQGNSGETVGWGHLTVSFAALKTNGTVEKRYAYSGSSGPGATTDPKYSIEVTPENSNWCDGNTVNTIYLPGSGSPDQYSTNAATFSNGFSIKFYKNGEEVQRVSTHSPKTIAVGELLDLGVVTEHLKDAPEVHTATSPAITGAEDLGASGTANCYIVDGSVGGNANKVFKFKAFRGNSSIGAGLIKSVNVLWQTNNSGTDPSAVKDVIASVDFDKQEANEFYEICFQMPAELQAGNAVIAAYDGDYEAGEPTGNILWSWHIWVPSESLTTPTPTYSFYNHPIMDRNLGALVPATTSSVPVESYGLNYQWGRKDPFVGASAIGVSTNAAVKGTAMSMAGATMTVTETIQNPTRFANAGDGVTWMTTNDNTAWREGIKTIYDPCPPGYIVMSYDSAIPMCGDLSSITGWADNTDYFKLGISNPAVFPYAGYRDGGSTSNVGYTGSRSAIWTTFTNESGSSAYHMNERYNSAHTSGTTGKARGLSVRCVKEEMYSPTVGGISIGTSMADWDNVQTVVSEISPSTSRTYMVFKATYDSKNLYIYTKRKWNDDLWKDSSGGYVYYYFDTDNNASTGFTHNNAVGLESYIFLYLYTGSKTSPTIPATPAGGTSNASISNVSAWGVITDANEDSVWSNADYIETEVCIPRANIPGLTNGNTVRIYSFSNKSGGNLTSNNLKPITIKFEN